jgi:CubicO group peptidase (beta-lactamase class C family)
MKRIYLYCLVTIGFIHIELAAQTLNQEQKTQIESYLEHQIIAGAPGLAVGIVQNGEIIFEKYLGLANLEHAVVVNEQSSFNLASMAKQFTALAILKLSLEGKLSLDEDIRTYLPELFPNLNTPIYIRQLLNHSSGIRDFYDLLSLKRDPWWRKEGFDNQEAYELLKSQQKLNFAPGTDHLYSNSNYTLLAKVVEVVSGQTFHAYSRQLFDSLGMPNTFFLEDYMKVVSHQARPYTDWGDGVWKEYPMMTNLYGDGFLFTTLPDQLHYEQLIQQSNSELIIQSQQVIPNAAVDFYGFGLELSDKLGHKAAHHAGSTGAYHAQVVRYPKEKLSIMVMSNNGTIWSGFIADKVAFILLPEKKEQPTKQLFDVSDYQQKIPLEELSGRYISAEGNLINILVNKDTLQWQQGNNRAFDLVMQEGSVFHTTYDAEVKLAFTADAFTLFQPMAKKRVYRKLASFSPSKNYLNSLVGSYKNVALGLSWDITVKGDSLFIREKEGRSGYMKLLAKDYFTYGDYLLKAVRDTTEVITGIHLTYSRLRKVNFRKVANEKSLRLQYFDDGSYVQVATTSSSVGKGSGDILLTRNGVDNNELWYKLFGGKGYDKASSVLITKDGGFLIVGSTSSYGQGNYDVWVLKTDASGKLLWDKTFGGFGNEYGVSAIEKENSYLVKAEKQSCSGEQFQDCKMQEWLLEIPKQSP